MTYRLPYAVTVRAPHGIDLRAGYKPWGLVGPEGCCRARPASATSIFCRFDQIAELACYA